MPRDGFPHMKTVGVKSVIDDLLDIAFDIEYDTNGDVISVDEWERVHVGAGRPRRREQALRDRS